MALQFQVPTLPCTSTRFSRYMTPKAPAGSTSLGLRFRCFSIPVTYDPTVPRRSEHYQYQPTIWDYDCVESLESSFAGEAYTNQTETLKEIVKAAMKKVVGSLAQLELIDDLERLGIGQLFEDDINRNLNEIYSQKDKFLKDNPYAAALTFRILRQHGFKVSQEIPSKIVTTVNDVGVAVQLINPDYHLWRRRDQQLLIWLNATISESLLSYFIGAPSSHALWTSLASRFAAISRSHVLHLKSRLQVIKKGASTVTEYLQNIKSITDNLAAAGSPVDDVDLVHHILHGLSTDYNAFVTSIRVRNPPVTADDLLILLLSEELSLEDHCQGSIDRVVDPKAFQATNLYTNRGRGSNNSFRGRGRGRNAYQRNHNNNNNVQQQRSSSSYSFFVQPGQNKCFTEFSSSPIARPVCQICEKPGHKAIDCYNCMNHSFQGRVPPAKLAAMVAHQGSSFNTNAPWFLDSGATSHMTNDLNNLNFRNDYNGTDRVTVGNGEHLPISHIGSYFGEDALPRET